VLGTECWDLDAEIWATTRATVTTVRAADAPHTLFEAARWIGRLPAGLAQAAPHHGCDATWMHLAENR
jgi:hypothetical protein